MKHEIIARAPVDQQQLGDRTPEEVRGCCKLHHGISIRREEPEYDAAYRARVIGLTYEIKLALMMEPWGTTSSNARHRRPPGCHGADHEQKNFSGPLSVVDSDQFRVSWHPACENEDAVGQTPHDLRGNAAGYGRVSCPQNRVHHRVRPERGRRNPGCALPEPRFRDCRQCNPQTGKARSRNEFPQMNPQTVSALLYQINAIPNQNSKL